MRSALCRFRRLWILLLLGLPTSYVRAQDSVPPSGFVPPPAPAAQYEAASQPLAQYQAVPPPPAPTVAAPPASVPNSTLPVSGLDGCWIASSWNCRQSAPHACPCGDLEFYYRSCDGQLQMANHDAFNASLAQERRFALSPMEASPIGSPCPTTAGRSFVGCVAPLRRGR